MGGMRCGFGWYLSFYHEKKIPCIVFQLGFALHHCFLHTFFLYAKHFLVHINEFGVVVIWIFFLWISLFMRNLAPRITCYLQVTTVFFSSVNMLSAPSVLLFLFFLFFSCQWPCKETAGWRHTIQCPWNSWIKYTIHVHHMPSWPICNTWYKTTIFGRDCQEYKEIFYIWDSSFGW